MPKTFREIRQDRRQHMWEVAADREDDKNVKLGPDKVASDPSDPDEFDELEDDLDRTHTEVDAVRPIYVKDKLGQYTTAAGRVTSSGTMAQMTQQAATKNLKSEYMQEEVEEELDENAFDTLKKIVARKQAQTIRLEDGSSMAVDMTTANALLAVHGALNVHNQKKMASLLNSNKAGFAKMSKFAFKQFGAPLGKLANAPVSGEDVEEAKGYASIPANPNTTAERDRDRKAKIARAAKAREKDQAKNKEPGVKQRKIPGVYTKYRKGNEKFSEDVEIDEGGMGGKAKKAGKYPKGWEKKKKPGKKQKTIQGLPISKRDDKDPEAMDRFHKRTGYYPESEDVKNVGEEKETPAERETRMKASFSKVRGKPSFDDRQKAFASHFYNVNKRKPNKQELRAAGVGKGGGNPAGEKAWKAVMAKLKKAPLAKKGK